MVVIEHFPLKGGVRYEKRADDYGGVRVEVCLFEDMRGLYLWQINAVERQGTGAGTRALQRLCAEADRRKIAIRLLAAGGSASRTHRLVAWYRRHRFAIDTWTGKGDDRTCAMIRQPQGG